MPYWYKIVDKDSNDNIKTLFHGVNRSRILKFDKWLEAEMKMVKDGTSKTSYLSGWHIAPSYEECILYLQYFKNREPKTIVKCEAQNIWKKEHSRHNIFLAQWIKILEEVIV